VLRDVRVRRVGEFLLSLFEPGRGSLSPIEGPIFPMYYPASSLDKELGLISCRTIASFAGDDCSHSEDSVFGTAGLFGTAPQYQEHQNGRKWLKNELQ
jgi:hypothetical protein